MGEWPHSIISVLRNRCPNSNPLKAYTIIGRKFMFFYENLKAVQYNIVKKFTELYGNGNVCWYDCYLLFYCHHSSDSDRTLSPRRIISLDSSSNPEWPGYRNRIRYKRYQRLAVTAPKHGREQDFRHPVHSECPVRTLCHIGIYHKIGRVFCFILRYLKTFRRVRMTRRTEIRQCFLHSRVRPVV